MKKLLALLLALVLGLNISIQVFAEEDGDSEISEDNDEKVLWGYGYLNPYQGFYIVIPKGWAAIGSGTKNNEFLYANSKSIFGSGLDDLLDDINENNDILICMSKDKKQSMIITYGKTEFIGDDTLIDRLDEIEANIRSNIGTSIGTITFESDSGAFQYSPYNSSSATFSILRVHMKLKQSETITDVDQYYLIFDNMLHIITFIDVPESVPEGTDIENNYHKTMLISSIRSGVSDYSDEYPKEIRVTNK